MVSVQKIRVQRYRMVVAAVPNKCTHATHRSRRIQTWAFTFQLRVLCWLFWASAAAVYYWLVTLLTTLHTPLFSPICQLLLQWPFFFHLFLSFRVLFWPFPSATHIARSLLSYSTFPSISLFRKNIYIVILSALIVYYIHWIYEYWGFTWSVCFPWNIMFGVNMFSSHFWNFLALIHSPLHNFSIRFLLCSLVFRPEVSVDVGFCKVN